MRQTRGRVRWIVSLWPLREERGKIKLLDRVLLRSRCFNLFSYILSIAVGFFCFVFFLKQVQRLINGFCLGKTNSHFALFLLCSLDTC